MTEKEYTQRLEEETGLKFGKEFGFILGTNSPYSVQGLISSVQTPGYIIWKRVIKGGDSIYRELSTPGMNFEDTKRFLILEDEDFIEFLKEKGLCVIDGKCKAE